MSGMRRLRERVDNWDIEHMSIFIYDVIRKDLSGKLGDDDAVDFLWDLVNTEFGLYADKLDAEGPDKADSFVRDSVRMWKRDEPGNAANLERWLKMAIRKYGK